MDDKRIRLIRQVMTNARFFLDPRLSIQEQRRRMETLARLMIHLPKGVEKESVLIGNVKGEWISPYGFKSSRAILYLHGGGYTLCSPATHRGITGALALTCKVRLLVPEYRLAPEHPFPAALEDALTSYRWLLTQGFAPHQIAMGGDSAGGGLALATAISLRDSGEPLPAALFLISPWTDLTFSGESHRTRQDVDPIFGNMVYDSEVGFAPSYLGRESPSNPLISPLLAELTGLPPSIIHVGDNEILLNDSTRLFDKMKAENVEAQIHIWQGLWHVFQAFVPFLPESRQSINEIGGFISKYINSSNAVDISSFN
jgi:acetyl esterase/lipase